MKKERVENLHDIKNAEQSGADGGDKRQRSTIAFPYNDLDDAVAIAKAIHGNAGTSCTIDQLAAYLKVSITSGAFRVRVANASTFGLTENERGEIRLTDLGRRIADASQEAASRVEAFLAVPLYAKVYEHFKGYTLPGAAALEKYMSDVGVSSKQTDKARQAMMRSAKQAGFFAHGEDRLVRPAGPGTKPIEPPKEKDSKEVKAGTGNGGGTGTGSGDGLHPFIVGLLQSLPAPGADWSIAERIKWLQAANMIFDLIYKGNDGRVKIEQDG